MLKKAYLIVLTLILALTTCLTGCGKPEDNSASTDGGELSGEINVFLPLDAYSKKALENVKIAYRQINKNVQINIDTVQDADAYTKAVEGIILATKNTEADIVQTNVVSQYYGTDKIVDFTQYLNQKNKYSENGNTVWKKMLDEDAYRTEDSMQTIPNISFQSNCVLAYYNKKVFSENGWSVPTDWASLLDLLKKAREAGYTNPLGVNYDKSGIEGNVFGWLLRMYADQYFRDVVETVHSQEKDFSYIEDVDYGWEFDLNDSTVDMRSNYTYNISRLIDAYFNGNTINTESARYADMMANFYDLTRYCSSSYTASGIRDAFHKGVLNIENGSYPRSESAVVYISRLDYMSDYQTSLGSVLKYADDRIPVDEFQSSLGWFELPAMTDNAKVAGGAPASNALRTLGGPDHRPVGIVKRNQAQTNLCIDFLKFLFSKQGMEAYYEVYADMGIICSLNCLVKGFEVPSEIKVEGIPSFEGDCGLNPYQFFSLGYSEKNVQSSTGGTVNDGVVSAIQGYLTNAEYSSWDSYGKTIYDKMLSGFGEYASWKGFKYSAAGEANKYFVINPYKVKQ